jgi:HPt (histidine-containing phosphotransfer) domain-containing protein
MNGIHFMEILKKHSSYKNQPIIAMTGRTNLSIEDYINSGFSDVLMKPFNTNKLQSILQYYFYSILLNTNSNPVNEDAKETNGFSIISLGSFLNNDAMAIKKTLRIFLEDTKKNKLLLQQAKKNNDIETINNISHKMLSMLKQLDVKTLIPYLEAFETSTTIEDELFVDFENKLNSLITSLEDYI